MAETITHVFKPQRQHKLVSVPTGVSMSQAPDGTMTTTQSGFVDECGWCGSPWPCVPSQLEAAQATITLLEAVRAASEPLAGAVGELLKGRLLMEPSRHSSMTFEAMLMLIQMLDIHLAAYREAAARLNRGTVGT